MNDKENQLQSVIKFSETMLKDAEAGNWDRVIDIETERGKLLERLFSNTEQNNTVADMDDKIRKIIHINEQLEAIAITAREYACNDVAEINKGRSAVAMYGQNSM